MRMPVVATLLGAHAVAGFTAPTKIPSVDVFDSKFPPVPQLNIAEYCAGKNVVIVGLPGAFTPTWSGQQVPGYLENQEAFKDAGVDEVIVYCVNDPAVMQAWGNTYALEGSIVKFLADPAAELTKALDMEMVHPGPPSVGIIGRCKRFAIHAINGEVKTVKISEGPDDPAGDDDPSATLAPGFLEAIKAEPDFVPGSKKESSGPSAADKAAAAAAFVNKEVAANDVVIFSKDTCPFCTKTKNLFADELKVDASIFELNTMDDGADIQDALLEITGQRTVPSVFVKGKHIGGNDDTQSANKDGKLKEMLGL